MPPKLTAQTYAHFFLFKPLKFFVFLFFSTGIEVLLPIPPIFFRGWGVEMGNWVLLPPPSPSSLLRPFQRVVGAGINHVVVVVGVRLDGSETYTSSSFFLPSVSLSISTSVGKKKAHGRTLSPRRGEERHWDRGKRVNFYFFSLSSALFTLPILFWLYTLPRNALNVLRLVSPIIFNWLKVADHMFHLLKFWWRSEIRKYSS